MKKVKVAPATVISGGSKGGCQGRAPPWGPKFFHFHAVFGQKNRFAHPLWELAPPLGKILDPPLVMTRCYLHCGLDGAG